MNLSTELWNGRGSGQKYSETTPLSSWRVAIGSVADNFWGANAQASKHGS